MAARLPGKSTVVFDRTVQFNTVLYRSVWPDMFLHEGGSVLHKGIVAIGYIYLSSVRT
ncbi:hypothetical protein DPMN_026929, partial [Dreissena polymorpha]